LIEKEIVIHKYGAIQCSIEKYTKFYHFPTELKISFNAFAVGTIKISPHTDLKGVVVSGI